MPSLMAGNQMAADKRPTLRLFDPAVMSETNSGVTEHCACGADRFEAIPHAGALEPQLHHGDSSGRAAPGDVSAAQQKSAAACRGHHVLTPVQHQPAKQAAKQTRKTHPKLLAMYTPI